MELTDTVGLARIGQSGEIVKMNCKTCGTVITEQTAKYYNGQCVPCLRKATSKRVLFWPLGGIIETIQFSLTSIPFHKSDVLAKLCPPLTRSQAKAYYRGLKTTFLSGRSKLFSIDVFVSMGFTHGLMLRKSPERLDDLLHEIVLFGRQLRRWNDPRTVIVKPVGLNPGEDPKKLVEQDLGFPQMASIRDHLGHISSIPSPFTRFRLYRVAGIYEMFDFPTLPFGSYCIYAASAQQAIRLTRKGKEIQIILKEEWENLAMADPVELSTVLLWFFGVPSSDHHVLRDLEDLRKFAQPEEFPRYVINENKLATVQADIGHAHLQVNRENLELRVVTLLGWMHDKQNLGIETIHIARDGMVTLGKRRTLLRRVFETVPHVRY